MSGTCRVAVSDFPKQYQVLAKKVADANGCIDDRSKRVMLVDMIGKVIRPQLNRREAGKPKVVGTPQADPTHVRAVGVNGVVFDYTVKRQGDRQTVEVSVPFLGTLITEPVPLRYPDGRQTGPVAQIATTGHRVFLRFDDSCYWVGEVFVSGITFNDLGDFCAIGGVAVAHFVSENGALHYLGYDSFGDIVGSSGFVDGKK